MSTSPPRAVVENAVHQEDWFHVVIVGAGVAGMLLALAVASMDSGLDVALVDHSRVAYPEEEEDLQSPDSSTLPTDHVWLNPYSLEILDRLKLLESVEPLARHLTGFTIIESDEIEPPPQSEVTLPQFPQNSWTKYRGGLVVEQWKLERFLAARLEALPVSVYRFHAVTAMKFDCFDERPTATEYPVSITCREYKPTSLTFQWAAPPRTLMTRFVIGADGHHSVVRRALGIELAPCRTAEHEYMMADFQMEPNPESDAVIDLDVWRTRLTLMHRRSGSGLIFPFREPFKFRLLMRRRRVSEGGEPGADENTEAASDGKGYSPALSSERSPANTHLLSSYKRLTPANEDQLRHIAEVIFGSAWRVQRVLWRRAFAIGYERADTVVRLGTAASTVAATQIPYGGILIASAARGMPPFWGGPLNLAIEDVFSLAWRLVYVLSRRANPAILSQDFNQQRLERNLRVFEVCAQGLDTLMQPRNQSQSESWVAEKLKQLFQPSPQVSQLSLMAQFPTLGDSAFDTLPMSEISLAIINRFDRSIVRLVTLADCQSLRQHCLIILFRCLPYGTRYRTVLGCERAEHVTRYSPAEVEAMVAFAHSLQRRLQDVTVVWVITAASAVSTEPRNVILKHIQQLPVELLRKIPEHCQVCYDLNGEAYAKLRLVFRDPSMTVLNKRTCHEEAVSSSGAGFSLFTPDGRCVCEGLSGQRSQSLDEYLQHLACSNPPSDNL